MGSEGDLRALRKPQSYSIKAALTIEKRQFPRDQVITLLTQMREKMERAEAARMAEADKYERVELFRLLRNPWMLTSQQFA